MISAFGVVHKSAASKVTGKLKFLQPTAKLPKNLQPKEPVKFPLSRGRK